MALDPSRLILTRIRGLSEEAMWAHLGSLGAAPPLLLHRSLEVEQSPGEGPTEREFRQRVREAMGMRALGNAALSQQSLSVVHPYHTPDALEGFEREALMMLGWRGGTPVEHMEGCGYLLRRGSTVFNSTARQLGLVKTEGVPPLQNYIMDINAPKQCRHAMRQILMMPPSPDQKILLHKAVGSLASPMGSSGLPQLVIDLTADRIVRVVVARQASQGFFLTVAEMMAALIACLDTSAPQPLRVAASFVVSFVTSSDPCPLPVPVFLERLRKALDTILAVIPGERIADRLGYSSGGEDTEGGEERFSKEETVAVAPPSKKKGSRGKPAGAGAVAGADDGGDGSNDGMGDGGGGGAISGVITRGGPEVFEFLRRHVEMHHRVRPEHIKEAAEAVDAAVAAVMTELSRIHSSLCEDWSRRVDYEARRGHFGRARLEALRRIPIAPHLVADTASKRVWVSIPMCQKAPGIEDTAKALGLHKADRNGSPSPPQGKCWFTSQELVRAQAQWQRNHETAADAARERLQALADELGPLLHPVGTAASASILLQALMLHVEHGVRNGWTMPQLTGPHRGDGGGGGVFGGCGVSGGSDAADCLSLVLRGVWPYWMKPPRAASGSGGVVTGGGGSIGGGGGDQQAVPNDIELRGMALLTGPNMAGKSTALRTLCAATLLANCGLMVPATGGGAVPHFSHYILRNFSGDAPTDSMSAWGVEMRDMSKLFEEVSGGALPFSSQPSCLVLVDELGKGTDFIAGTSIAAAMLDELVACGCTGVFASHLHLLQSLPLNMDGLARWRMGVVEDTEWGAAAAVAREAPEYPLAAFGLSPKRPTWRIEPGTCTESLALEVALKCGLPVECAVRAAHFLRLIPDYQEMVRPQQDREEVAAEDPRPPLGGSAGSVYAADIASSGLGLSGGDDSSCHDCGAVISSGASSGDYALSSSRLMSSSLPTSSLATRGLPSPPISATEPILTGVVQWLAEEGHLKYSLPGGAAAAATADGSVAAPCGPSSWDVFSWGSHGNIPFPEAEGPAAASGTAATATAAGNGDTGCRAAPAAPLPELVRLGRGFQPQAAHAGRICVYVLRICSSRYFYGGKTDNIRARHQQHRKKHGDIEMIYVPLDSRAGPTRGGVGGSGGATGRWEALDGAQTAAEGELIRRLNGAGLPMWSTRDAGKRRPPQAR